MTSIRPLGGMSIYAARFRYLTAPGSCNPATRFWRRWIIPMPNSAVPSSASVVGSGTCVSEKRWSNSVMIATLSGFDTATDMSSDTPNVATGPNTALSKNIPGGTPTFRMGDEVGPVSVSETVAVAVPPSTADVVTVACSSASSIRLAGSRSVTVYPIVERAEEKVPTAIQEPWNCNPGSGTVGTIEARGLTVIVAAVTLPAPPPEGVNEKLEKSLSSTEQEPSAIKFARVSLHGAAVAMFGAFKLKSGDNAIAKRNFFIALSLLELLISLIIVASPSRRDYRQPDKLQRYRIGTVAEGRGPIDIVGSDDCRGPYRSLRVDRGIRSGRSASVTALPTAGMTS